MGRMYYAPLNIGSHSAQIDYFEILAATDKPILLHGFELGQSSEAKDAEEEQIIAVLKRVTGAPTSGSGGSAPTPVPLTPNDTAAGATVETGNTTKLTGGTSVEISRHAWNVRSPYLWLPPPEGRAACLAGTRLVLEEVTTPADAFTGPIGWILFEELL